VTQNIKYIGIKSIYLLFIFILTDLYFGTYVFSIKLYLVIEIQ